MKDLMEEIHEDGMIHLTVERYAAFLKIIELTDSALAKLSHLFSPIDHELDVETKEEFKTIIARNIDKDDNDLKKMLKNAWEQEAKNESK